MKFWGMRYAGHGESREDGLIETERVEATAQDYNRAEAEETEQPSEPPKLRDLRPEKDPIGAGKRRG